MEVSVMTEDRLRSYGVLLLRVALGTMFIAHSMLYMLMTLTLDGTAKFFVSIGLPARDKLGYREVASSRRAEQERDCLRGLGADEITTLRAFWGWEPPRIGGGGCASARWLLDRRDGE